MTARSCSLLALWLLLAPAAPAVAEDEITTAIRLEAKDAAAAKVASSLTKAMRAVAAKRTRRAKPSASTVDAAVADADCSILQPSCAASVGAALAVTHMLVGQVESRGSRHTVTLSLVNVRTKQRVRSLRDVVATAASTTRLARSLYTRILDEGTGELVITANARRGQVLIDGIVVTELYDGRATISGLALGTHALEIRASGYRPFASDVSVDGRTQEAILLEPAE